MSLLKTITALCLVGVASFSYADEVSKKACAQFLPAFGDNNIDLINNGAKRDYPLTEERGQKLAGILKTVNDQVDLDTQARCDKGAYPIMDLNGCYDKCKGEVEKKITGSFAWNYQDRTTYKNLCYNACTGAYVAQNAITKTLRKSEAEGANCAATAPAVFDSRKSKMIDGVMQNNSASDIQSAKDK